MHVDASSRYNLCRRVGTVDRDMNPTMTTAKKPTRRSPKKRLRKFIRDGLKTTGTTWTTRPTRGTPSPVALVTP